MTVSITGTGAVSCAGLGVQAVYRLALSGGTGVHQGLGRIPPDAFESLKSKYPKAFNVSIPVGFSFAAAIEATAQAGWANLNDDDGLILATTTGQICRWEPDFMKFLRGQESSSEFAGPFSAQSLGLTLTELAKLFQFKGKTQLVTSACSAGTQAIALAAMWVASGKVKRCLVGGVEILSELTTAGFRSLQLLSEEPARPFDRARQGINLSEAAAFLCIEKDGAFPLAKISGYGFSTDAYHLASPEPEGKGCLRAMQNALQKASLTPDDIRWVHAHGTGSKANDQAECAAIHSLFGERLPFVSSTKYTHGHALGASGTLETVLCVEALRSGTILKTSGLQIPDETLRALHPKQNLKVSYDHILKNTLGFGGNNAALILSRVHCLNRSKTQEGNTSQIKIGVIGVSVADATAISSAFSPSLKPSFRRASPNMKLAHAAMLAAMDSSELPVELFREAAFVHGSSYGELNQTKEFLKSWANEKLARPLFFQNSLHNGTLGFLSLEFGVQGPSFTVSHQYFTGEKSLELAIELLEDGVAEAAFVTSVEVMDPDLLASLNEKLPEGWKWCDGAACVVLATEAFAKRMNRKILASFSSLQFGVKSEHTEKGTYSDSNGLEQWISEMQASEVGEHESILVKRDQSASRMLWRKF